MQCLIQAELVKLAVANIDLLEKKSNSKLGSHTRTVGYLSTSSRLNMGLYSPLLECPEREDDKNKQNNTFEDAMLIGFLCLHVTTHPLDGATHHNIPCFWPHFEKSDTILGQSEAKIAKIGPLHCQNRLTYLKELVNSSSINMYV